MFNILYGLAKRSKTTHEVFYDKKDNTVNIESKGVV